MISIRFECREDERDELVSELYARDTLGIVETELSADRIALQAFFNEPLELGTLAPWFIEQEQAEERDWVTETQQSYPPLLIGERFFLAPEWTNEETPPGRLRLPTHPGMACGTGYHEATQLCLEAMEQLIQPGNTFVDIGVGTGLLCVAASLLGASRRIGCDIDPDAITQARENTRNDGVEVALLVGSARALRTSIADVLVANISAPAHMELAAEYARLLKPGGAALISGFEEYEEEPVLQALTAAGLRTTGRRERHYWLCEVVTH